MKPPRFRVVATALLAGLAVGLTVLAAAPGAGLAGRQTVATRLAEFGPAVKFRLAAPFRNAGVAYPPPSLILVGLKQENLLEVWAPNAQGVNKRVATYPILAASGQPGPKLREGDSQVPEGFYEIESLNPNSAYHLSLRVNYPSKFDRAQAKSEGRTNLGGDIMIHGNNVSAGCLAMGDTAAEDLFVLAAVTGLKNIRVLLSPCDFRKTESPAKMSRQPDWVTGLHTSLRTELLRLK